MKPKAYPAAVQWIKKAASDVKARDILLDTENTTTFEVICFHAQQAAETSLKAIPTASEIPFPKTHHLPTLHKLLPSGAPVALTEDDQVDLTYFAVRARSPDDWHEVEIAIARRLTQRAHAAYEEARQWIEASHPNE